MCRLLPAAPCGVLLAVAMLLVTVCHAGCKRSGADSQRLAVARALHQQALDAYRREDRTGGDARTREALRAYEAAGALTVDLGSLHHELIVGRVAAGRLDEAEALAREWLALFPDDFDHLETLGKLRFRLGRYGEAAGDFAAALRARPDDVATLRRRVESLSFEGARDAALQAVDSLLESSRLLPLPAPTAAARVGEPETLAAAARALSRFQEHARAAPLWERLVALRPGDPVPRLELGAALAASGQHAAALTALSPLHAHPEHGAEALRESAACQAREGRHAEAVQLLGAALVRDPTDGAAYHQLAAALRRVGRDDAAAAMERQAASLAASRRERSRVSEQRAAGRGAEARVAEAIALALAGRYREADARLAVVDGAQNPVLTLRRAELYLDWLRAAEARDLLSAVGAGGGPAVTVASLRERARSLLEDPLPAGADARLELRQRIARTPWPDAAPLLVELARAEVGGDCEQAVMAARLAHAADPASADALRWLARLLDDPAEVFLRIEAWAGVLNLAPGDAEARAGLEAARRQVDGWLEAQGRMRP